MAKVTPVEYEIVSFTRGDFIEFELRTDVRGYWGELSTRINYEDFYKDLGIPVLQVVAIEVEPLREGIGTALYEAALAAACEMDMPLVSDWVSELSNFSEAFWQKQLKLDRVELRYIESGDEGSGWVYLIDDPCRVESLSGL